MGCKKVLERFEITDVSQVRDYLGMMGDASDNIPGLPGVGEKTAQKIPGPVWDDGKPSGTCRGNKRRFGRKNIREQGNRHVVKASGHDRNRCPGGVRLRLLYYGAS